MYLKLVLIFYPLLFLLHDLTELFVGVLKYYTQPQLLIYMKKEKIQSKIFHSVVKLKEGLDGYYTFFQNLVAIFSIVRL